MQMAQIIGGYSLGGADLLRRAMGKKKPEEMAKHRELFREGADKNGLTAAKADEIFDLMEKFAGYGFNKSHAAAYALLAYYTAWLKAHHPAAFMAANMSLAMDDTDKVKILYDDCLSHHNQLKVLPPDVNQSVYRFEPADTQTVRYGLGAIKGSGQSAIEEILRAREEKPFVDLFDFCRRIDRRVVNRRTIEALIRAGAFDTLNANRAQLMASVSMAMEAAEQASASANQVSLFDLGDEDISAPLELVNEPAWTDKKKLQEEKAALGFYLSGHMFDSYTEEVRRFVRTKLRDLSEGRDKLVAGVIASLRTMMTQRGKMVIVTLDDGTGQVDATIFNEQFEANKHFFKEDELLIVKGNARPDAFSGGLRFTTESVMDLGSARAQFARALRLSFNGNADWNRLRATLQPHCSIYRVSANGSGNGSSHGGGYGRRGGQGGERETKTGLPVHIMYRRTDAECESRLGDDWNVQPGDALLTELREWLTPSAVQLIY